MFKNNLKIAWRNLRKNVLFSSINIFGLSASLGITILLFLFIKHETSFNQSLAGYENMYRIITEPVSFNSGERWAGSAAMIGPTAVTEIPEVTDQVRLLKHGFGDRAYLSLNGNEFAEDFLYYADPGLFQLFELELIHGNKGSALKNPHTAIISRSTAKRLYGTEDVVGRIFKVDDRREVEITGVYKDLATNVSLDGNIYISLSSTQFSKNPTWSNASLETFLLTVPGTQNQTLDDKLAAMLETNVHEDQRWYEVFVQPMDQIHLYSEGITNVYSSKTGSIDQVKALAFLALLVLIISCINYMNLTTARSQKRGREVGVSKTLGASKSHLLYRFYIETGLITGIAILIGLGLAMLGLPFFNELSGREMDIQLLFEPMFISIVLFSWIVVTFIAGSYPAFYLSGFSASRIMNSNNPTSGWTAGLRKGLVVVQFAASALLTVGVFIIHDQLEFIRNKDLGFTADKVVAVPVDALKDRSVKELFVSKVRKLAQIKGAGLAQGYPSQTVSGRLIHKPDAEDGGMPVRTNHSDAATLEVLNLKFIAGKNLPSLKAAGDTMVDIVVNRKIATYLGYSPEDAIGQPIYALGTNHTQIVGVIEDFHYNSLHEPVGAYMFHNYDQQESVSYALISGRADEWDSILKSMEQTFKEVAPTAAFDYSFIDAEVSKLYKKEDQTASIGTIFSFLAILVTCLGMLGLAAFIAEQKEKEIGVRKVLGASLSSITKLLSKEFVLLVLIGIVIAFPIAYWLMEKWLQDFAYRTEIGLIPFVLTTIATICITLITVGTQAVKAGLRNPINALKKE